MTACLYYPTRNSRNIAYVRDENDGYVSIKSISRGDVGAHLLNATAKAILDLCEGGIELNQLHLRMSRLHPDASLPQLKGDVDAALKQLTALEVIEWRDDRTPFAPERDGQVHDLGDGLGLRQAGETDLKPLAELLRGLGLPCRRPALTPPAEWTFYLSPYSSPLEYALVPIRMRQFQFYESLWLVERDGAGVGVLGFRSPVVGLDIEESAVATLALLCLRRELPAAAAAAALARASAGCAAWLINRATTKVRAVLHQRSRLCSEAVPGLLEAAGYRLEAALERESVEGGTATFMALPLAAAP